MTDTKAVMQQALDSLIDSRPFSEYPPEAYKKHGQVIAALIEAISQPVEMTEPIVWCQYIAEMIETYLQMSPKLENRASAIASIIERRLMHLLPPAHVPETDCGNITQTNLVAAAQAVLDRWNSPQWDWGKCGPTGDLMQVLRDALDAQPVYAAPQSIVQPKQSASDNAEIARLTACLKAANASTEKFEREWYLRGDVIEAMQAQQVPKGMCLMPIEATTEMIKAVIADNYIHGDPNAARIVLKDEYRAMVAAIAQPAQLSKQIHALRLCRSWFTDEVGLTEAHPLVVEVDTALQAPIAQSEKPAPRGTNAQILKE